MAVNLPGVGSPDSSGDASRRVRLAIAGGTAVVLALVVAIVVLSAGDDEDHTFEPAPSACVEAWNGESTNLVLGQHQATAHRYSRIQMVRLGRGGAIAPMTDTAAPCGVIFASSSLDSELAAAALIESRDGWRPLSDGDVPEDTLADLQLGAQDEYNALINADGTIEPL
jgi:hypothetical protein